MERVGQNSDLPSFYLFYRIFLEKFAGGGKLIPLRLLTNKPYDNEKDCICADYRVGIMFMQETGGKIHCSFVKR